MIYVITHKKFKPVTTDGFYETLLVGADVNDVAEYAVKDNTGENISSKNAYFCELTGIYWLWKNVKDDIIGVCHYRRYFIKSAILNKNGILGQSEIKEYMGQADVILPRKRWFDGKNALDFYSKYHNIEDWNRMKSVVERICPDYMEDICWLEKQKKGYCYNMFIMTRELFNSYCEWLFSILFELEKITNIESYSKYNKRMYGFLSERMINIWIHHNRLKICEKRVYNPKMFSMLLNQTKEYFIRKIEHREK